MFYGQYVSNTLAGSANQSFFESDNTLLTGRVYYKLFSDAKEHALLFGDTIDGTFANGDYSRCNMTSGKWERKEEDAFLPSINLPVPSMVGCVRAVEKRIGFFWDSITQGIGSEKNSYGHWNAVLAEKLGEKNAYWNLGIGFARASDAATNGVWLQKAKQNDFVTQDSNF